MIWLLVFVLLLLIPLTAIVLDSHVGRALAARIERRDAPGPHDAMAERVADLEGEVERLSAEVKRLDEEGRFLHDLLQRRPDPRALGEGERPD